jgi:CSLREA domain-containing protein
MKQYLKTFFSATVVAFLFLLFTSPASAATFSVNSTTDAIDANPGDGICATSANECTLRAAVQEANALAGADTITLIGGQTYNVTLTGAGDDTGAVSDLDINSELEINSTGISTVDGGGVNRVFDLQPGADVNLRNLVIQNGVGENGGVGGGILIHNGASASLFDSVVTSNQNTGIFNSGAFDARRTTVSNNSGAQGGGVYNDAFMAFAASTLSSNTAIEGGAAWNTGVLFFENSTVSGNSASNTAGAVMNNLGSVSFTSSTIASNQAAEGTGGVVSILGSFDRTSFQNSIIANNSSANCEGAITSFDYNLSSDQSCNFGQANDEQGIDPLLGGLANNGGPTQTHALLIGSPAIDVGQEVGCLATDQRGIARPQGPRCDKGAFEFDGTVTPPTQPSNPSEANGATSPAPNDARPPMCTENAPVAAPQLQILSKTSTTVTLGWNSIDPVTHYTLSFTRNSDGAQYGASDIGKNTVYTVNFLNPGETYTFEVFGVNGCMPGPRSNKVSTKKVVKKAAVTPSTTQTEEVPTRKGGNQDYWTKEEMSKVVGDKNSSNTTSSAVLATPSANLTATPSAQSKNFVQALNRWILAFGIFLAGILWFITQKQYNSPKKK